MSGFVLERGVHVVEEHGYLKFLRRRFPKFKDRLMGFYNREIGQHVIGVWTNRDAGQVMCYQSRDRHDWGPSDVSHMEFNLEKGNRLRALERWKRQNFSKARARGRLWQEMHEKLHDRRERMRRAAPELQRDNPIWRRV